MTPEEQEIQRLLEQRRASKQAKPKAGEVTEEELSALLSQRKPKTRQYAEPTAVNNLLHIAKGTGRNILDAVNTAYNLEQIPPMLTDATGLTEAPTEQERQGMGLAESAITRSSQPVLKLAIDKAFGPGSYEVFEETVAGDVIDPATANPVVQGARTFTEWFGPGAFSKGLRAGAEKLASNLPRTNSGREAITDAAIAGTAATGEAIANNVGAFGIEGDTGELAGGSLGVVGSLLAGRAPSLNPFSALSRENNNVRGSNLNIPSADKRALQILTGNMGDPAASTERLAASLRRGDTGTFGVLAEDANIMDVERTVAGVPQNRRRVNEADAASQAQVAQRIADDIGPEGMDVAPIAGDRVTQARQAIEESRAQRAASAEQAGQQQSQQALQEAQRGKAEALQRGREEAGALREQAPSIRQSIAEAEQQAARGRSLADVARRADESAQRELMPENTTYEESTNLFNRVTEAEAEFQDSVVTPAWNEFLQGDGVPVSEVTSAVESALDSLRPSQKERILDAYPKVRGDDFWEEIKDGDLAPADFQEWISDLRDVAYDVDVNGNATMEQKLLRDVIRKAEDAIAENNDALKFAKQKTAEKYQRFREDRMLFARRAEPEEFAGRLIKPGDPAAVTQRLIEATKDPEVARSAIAWLKGKAQQGGGIDDAFIESYRPIIDALPEGEKAQFLGAAEARRGVAPAERAATAAEKEASKVARQGEQSLSKIETQAEKVETAAQRQAQRIADEGQAAADSALKKATQEIERVNQQASARQGRLDKSILSRVAKSPTKELTSLVTDPDKLGDLTSLSNRLKRMEEAGEADDAVMALKGTLRNIIDDKFLTDSSNVKRLLNEKGFVKSYAQMRDAGLISPDSQSRILENIRRNGTVEQRRNAIASLAVADADETIDLLASGLSALLITGLTGSQTLLVGAAVRRNVKTRLKRAKSEGAAMEYVKALEEMLFDPQTYLKRIENASKLLDEIEGENAIQAFVNDVVMRPLDQLSRTGQTAAGFNELDEES